MALARLFVTIVTSTIYKNLVLYMYPNEKLTHYHRFVMFSGSERLPGIYLKVLVLFFNSVLRPFQDYFSSYETGQLVGGAKKKHLTHPQAELGLSHMWPERGSNPHQTQR